MAEAEELMASKTKSRQKQFVSQAALQALVRYGPELSGLKELKRQAESNLGAQLAQAHGSARGIIQTVDQVTPQVAGIYDNAGLTQAHLNQTLLGHDLQGLGHVADSIKAGAALEATGMASRLNEAKTQSLTDLGNRRVQARQGEQFAVQSAQQQFVNGMTKVLQRGQDLARERGAFKSATVDQLRQSAEDRATKLTIEKLGNSQSERNSLRSAGIDPNTGQPIANGPLDPKKNKPKGPKLQTPEKHLAVQTDISRGVQALSTLDPSKKRRHDAAPLLIEGHKAQELYDPKTGKKQINPNGQPVSTPDVPGIGGLSASVAADLYYNGYVSRYNQQRLNRARLSVRQLGLTSYGDAKQAGKLKQPPKKQPPQPPWLPALLGGH